MLSTKYALQLNGTLDITLEQLDEEHWLASEKITAIGGLGITPTMAVSRLMAAISGLCVTDLPSDLTPLQQDWLINKFRIGGGGDNIP